MSLKNPVTPPGIDPGTVRLVAQCLNHYATAGPTFTNLLHVYFQVMIEYFKELEEESIRDNFVVIYELLDELLDFGYPQTTDSKILQE
jgi:hypothetical protein